MELLVEWASNSPLGLDSASTRMRGGVALALRKEVILSKRKRVGGAGIWVAGRAGVVVVDILRLDWCIVWK